MYRIYSSLPHNTSPWVLYRSILLAPTLTEFSRFHTTTIITTPSISLSSTPCTNPAQIHFPSTQFAFSPCLYHPPTPLGISLGNRHTQNPSSTVDESSWEAEIVYTTSEIETGLYVLQTKNVTSYNKESEHFSHGPTFTIL